MASVVKKAKKLGIILLAIGLAIILIQYFPIISSEVRYQLNKLTKTPEQEVTLATIKSNKEENKKYIIPKDKEFGLVIPKIGVNVPIVQNVDPFNAEEYQKALTKGVAHVEGTTLPEDTGNTVLFAHSSDNFYNANRYNAIFYLLNKLKKGDTIYIVRNNKMYEYEVLQRILVEPEEIDYMESSEDSKLTLITCWPPGTTFKRIVVVAK